MKKLFAVPLVATLRSEGSAQRVGWLRVMLPALFAAGCSSMSWETRTAPPEFQDGTRVLGEVVMVTTRQEALSGQGLLADWPRKLNAAGYTDADIVDGSEATVWSYCFGHNSGVPLCAHHGHYVVHIPPELRGTVHGDPDSNPETSGDLVEIELVRLPTGELVGTLVRVYRTSDDWGSCRDAYLERGEASSMLMALGGVGPPQANWLECDDLEAEGWLRQPVIGAPVSDGPPVSQWVRPPR